MSNTATRIRERKIRAAAPFDWEDAFSEMFGGSAMANTRDWLEDASHENGNYECVCMTCRQPFVGHKRRACCKECDARSRKKWERLAEVAAATYEGASFAHPLDRWQSVVKAVLDENLYGMYPDHLRAASPELLLALKAMVLNDRHTYRDCHKAALAAIAKAESRQSASPRPAPVSEDE